jgi:two-component system, OmpR family, sensor histidine kinase MprB
VTLRGRVGAAAAAAMAVTVLVAAGTVYAVVRANLRGEIDRSLAQRAQSVLERHRPAAGAGPGPGAGGFGGSGRLGGPGRFGRPLPGERFGGAEGLVQFLDPAGQVERAPGAGAVLPVTERADAIAASGAGRGSEDIEIGDVRVRVLTVGLGAVGAVQVARPLAEVDRVLDRVVTVLLVVGAAGIALAAALGAGVARLALAPVERFTSRTEQIASHPDLSERIEVTSSDELGRLARTFNAMLDELERAVDAQRALVADASHELRTPIASLRANIQVLEHGDRLEAGELAALRADIVSELDDLTALVSDVVELARGARPPAEPEELGLDELVGALVARAEHGAGRELEYRVELEPTFVRGDRERIARAVSNLLDNARKWSPPGGAVEVRLGDGVLCVRDHGPGFVDSDLPRVFDRFYRADAARSMSGSGLGLAIVRQTAESHGGWARAANAPGGGAAVCVRFSPG